MTENGAEIVVELSETSSSRPSEEPELQSQGEDEGSRTPQATASTEEARRPMRSAQTITSMSLNDAVLPHAQSGLR